MVFTHQNCVCNERLAFKYRHQTTGTMRTNNIDYSFVNLHPIIHRKVIENMNHIMDHYQPQLESFHNIIMSYHGRLRNKYIHARHILYTEGIQPKHYVNKCFIKDDKYHLKVFNSDQSVPKAPRAIQYQSGAATLYKAQFIIPIEKHFYSYLDHHGLRVFTKGMNNHDVAQLMVDSINSINDPVAIENDFSSFDASVCVNLLKLFHKFVIKHVPSNYRKRVKKALRYDLKVIGYTSKGDHYTTIGTITSGSIDTSFKGNFVNYYATVCILEFCNI